MATEDYGRNMRSAADFAMMPYNALMQGREYAAQEQRRNALVQQKQQELDAQQAEEAKWQAAVQARDLDTMYAMDPHTAALLETHWQEQSGQGLSVPPITAKPMAEPDIPKLPASFQEYQLRQKYPGFAAYQDRPARSPAPRAASPSTSGGATAGGSPAGTPPAKPIPTSALRIVDEAKQALSATAQSDALVTKAISDLQQGKVRLGVINNTEYRARNYAGASNEESRTYASLKQTLEKLRNNYLLLAKGVQTEGDAQRAWNSEIGESVQNDNQLALQQLEKARAMIQMQANAQQSRIDNIYSNFGAEAPPEARQPASAPQSLDSVVGKVITQGGKRYQVIRDRNGKAIAVPLK